MTSCSALPSTIYLEQKKYIIMGKFIFRQLTLLRLEPTASKPDIILCEEALDTSWAKLHHTGNAVAFETFAVLSIIAEVLFHKFLLSAAALAAFGEDPNVSWAGVEDGSELLGWVSDINATYVVYVVVIF